MFNIIYNFFAIIGWITLVPMFSYLGLFLYSAATGKSETGYYGFWLYTWSAIFWGANFILSLMDNDPLPYKSILAFMTAFSIFIAWIRRNNRNNRKKRKNLLQRLGEKSKQKIQKMVDKLVPSPIPSPV